MNEKIPPDSIAQELDATMPLPVLQEPMFETSATGTLPPLSDETALADPVPANSEPMDVDSARDITRAEAKKRLRDVVENALHRTGESVQALHYEARNAVGLLNDVAGDVALRSVEQGSALISRARTHLTRRAGQLKESFGSHIQNMIEGASTVGVHAYEYASTSAADIGEVLGSGIEATKKAGQTMRTYARERVDAAGQGMRTLSSDAVENLGQRVSVVGGVVRGAVEAVTNRATETSEAASVGREITSERARAFLRSRREVLESALSSIAEITVAGGAAAGDTVRALGGTALSASGRVEQWTRQFGEMYNRVGAGKKALLGIGMGAGAALTGGILPSIFVAGLMAQRAAGLAGMYVHAEKYVRDIARGDERKTLGSRELYLRLFSGSERKQKAIAATLAVAYTLGMSAVVGGAVRELASTDASALVRHWLQSAWSTLERASSHAADALNEHVITPMSDMAHDMGRDMARAGQETQFGVEHVSPAPDVSAAAEVPHVSAPPVLELPRVEAHTGKGAEYMLKRFWERALEQHLDPSAFPDNSPLHTLLSANPTDIDATVHRIAIEQGFLQENGSVLIQQDAVLTGSSDGALQISHFHHPPTPEVAVSHPADTPMSVAEPATPEASLNLDTATQPVDVSPQPEVGHTTDDVSGTSVEPAHTPSGEIAAVQPETHHLDIIVNKHGVEIVPSEAHIYVDAKGQLMTYGGTPQDQTTVASEFLKQHPDQTVFVVDENSTTRVPVTLNAQGEYTPGLPPRTRGFLGFFRQFMRPPQIAELTKIIK